MSNRKRTRTIDSFFMSSSSLTTKKPRTSANPGIQEQECDEIVLKKNDNKTDNHQTSYSSHPTYPFPIPHLPSSISHALRPSIGTTPSSSLGRPITDTDTDLDLLYFEPFIPRPASWQLFEFLRASLPFYRVEYDIARPSPLSSQKQKQRIRTPRWTTVFGLDDTAHFVPSAGTGTGTGDISVLVPDCRPGSGSYRASPRPMPQCLEDLRVAVERALVAANDREEEEKEDEEPKEKRNDKVEDDSTSSRMFNFCLVNYYASGADSISFHSDDERFLGPRPTIASLSLGATRDFLMKRKPAAQAPAPPAAKPLKLPLATGDMVVMRGATQASWLHSVPKRSGRNEHDGGRINITFRRARVKAGTENYYNYNVGAGPVYRWDAADQEMKPWSEKPRQY
ncbi:DNA repair family protein-like protein [Biscogniauxia mediterranea]|nr:DNA repair family protein-like protein [Biscogniauxia mediterranea]